MCNQGLRMIPLSPGCNPCFPGHLSHFQFYRINLLAPNLQNTQGLPLALFQGPGQNTQDVPPWKSEGWIVGGRAQILLLFFLSPSPSPALLPSHETQHPGVSLGWGWARLASLSLQGGRIWLIRTSCVVSGFYSAPPLPLL